MRCLILALLQSNRKATFEMSPKKGKRITCVSFDLHELSEPVVGAVGDVQL